MDGRDLHVGDRFRVGSYRRDGLDAPFVDLRIGDSGTLESRLQMDPALARQLGKALIEAATDALARPDYLKREVLS